MTGIRSKGAYTSANWHPPVGGGLGPGASQIGDPPPRCINCGCRHLSAGRPEQLCQWCCDFIAAQNVKAVMGIGAWTRTK